MIFPMLEINLKLKLKARNQLFIVKHYLVKNLVKFGKLFIRFSTQMGPVLKSCSFPIHRQGEIKNSHEPPWVETFLFAISLSKKLYDKNI